MTKINQVILSPNCYENGDWDDHFFYAVPCPICGEDNDMYSDYCNWCGIKFIKNDLLAKDIEDKRWEW